MSEFVGVVVVVIFAIVAAADATVIIICGPGGRRGRGGWVGVGWGDERMGGGCSAGRARGDEDARRARSDPAPAGEKQISRHEAPGRRE